MKEVKCSVCGEDYSHLMAVASPIDKETLGVVISNIGMFSFKPGCKELTLNGYEGRSMGIRIFATEACGHVYAHVDETYKGNNTTSFFNLSKYSKAIWEPSEVLTSLYPEGEVKIKKCILALYMERGAM